MKKSSIRLQIKTRKALLDDEEKALSAERVFGLVEKTAPFMIAQHVLLYHSLPDELSTHAFIEKWHEMKHFYLPRVNGVNLDILPYSKSRLHLGSFQIEEPDGEDLVDPSMIDLIIVPGVAYDRKGNRVGRGKGFYDRLLSTIRAVTMGVGYDFQLLDEDIEADDFDVPVDYVVTSTRIVKSPGRKK